MTIDKINIHVVRNVHPCYVKMHDGTVYEFAAEPLLGETFDEWFQRCGTTRGEDRNGY